MLTFLKALSPEFRPTIRLALPLVIAEVGWMTMGIVDTIMVGRLPNSAVAIGATGLGQSLYHSVAIFGGGLLLGMDTLVSHAYGREDHRDARQWLVNGLCIAFLLSPILMLGVSLWPTLMQLFGISPELVDPMRPFLHALNWGTLPLLTYFALRRYLQAINVVYPIMFALISANVANAVGDWVLIYGHWGFRAMGITGSGWSTCLSRIYMALVLAITLVYVESKNRMPTWAGAMRVELQRVIALLRLGTPAATQILFEIGAFSAATAFCAKLGPVPLSGHEIALNCAAFTFMVPLGISSAAAVRVGQQLGRGDRTGAMRAGWSAIALGVAFMASSGLVFISIPRVIARLFSPDPNVIRVGASGGRGCLSVV
jgi:multidrug resistance protein, MATE family